MIVKCYCGENTLGVALWENSTMPELPLISFSFLFSDLVFVLLWYITINSGRGDNYDSNFRKI
jgi:hypothetical protein